MVYLLAVAAPNFAVALAVAKNIDLKSVNY
jgi:hypothetical protein